MLASVKDFSDDLIVVDTGSTDNSREIAIEAGARVETFNWINDFSAARNFSLSLAKNPWILVLDTDETLDKSAVEQIPNLMKGGNSAFALMRHHYTANDITAISMQNCQHQRAIDLGATKYYITKDFRFFSNDPKVYYEGAVHESIEDSARSAKFNIEYTDLVIHHFGHLTSIEDRIQKNEFYLSLAIANASKLPNDWRAFYQVGAEFQSLNRHDEAISYFLQSTNLYAESNQVWRQLGISLCALGDILGGLNSLNKALSLNQTCSITWLALGEAFVIAGHLEAAENCFKTILGFNPNHEIASAHLRKLEEEKK